jgi:hypothetical protein
LTSRAARRSHAQDACREIETKYIFGFTEGSGVGLEGETEFSPDTIVNSGKRDGRVAATGNLDLTDFSRNRFKIKTSIEF